MTGMRITSFMVELEAGWASLSLHEAPDADTPNPAHVAVSVPCLAEGDAAATRARAIDAAIATLDAARAVLEAAR